MRATKQRPSDLIDLQTAVERTDLGYSTIRGYVSSGKLDAWRVGRQLRVSAGAVEALFTPVHPSDKD
jgi:excisionase family DNA binding protein